MHQRQGFTLLEFMIVITVIALVAGGIMIGRSMIVNAELQSIISDVNRFKNAAKMFHEKYRYLPGDLPTATTFWGTDTGCPTGDTSNALPRLKTCNGNGDGLIGGPYAGTDHPSPVDMGTYYYEMPHAWQHLANAGFIEGAYSGVGKGLYYQAGTSVPSSKAGNGNGYALFFSSTINSLKRTPDNVGHAGVFAGTYGHIIEYGRADDVRLSYGFNRPALSPSNAASIDQKIDDGLPSIGNVLGFATTDPYCGRCTTNTVSPVYDKVVADEILCALIFVTGL